MAQWLTELMKKCVSDSKCKCVFSVITFGLKSSAAAYDYQELIKCVTEGEVTFNFILKKLKKNKNLILKK